MARLTDANVALARQIISRYPRSRSALVPLLHLAQEQDGWLTDDAMAHIGELLGLEPAEVLGTASFYEMFKREDGRHLPGEHLHRHRVPSERRPRAARARARRRSA